jgi:hypothetical protein
MKMLPNGSLVIDTIKDIRGTIATLSEVIGDLQVLHDDEPPPEGVLPDGTPVVDMLEEMKEMRARIAEMKSLARQIASAAMPGASMSATLRDLIHIKANRIGKI